MAAIGPESIRVTSRLAIPLSEIELRYSRSSGPGGQHAQKTETRVEAVFRPEDSETLSEAQKRRVLERTGPFVTAVAQDERSRMRNRELALERLALALAAALKTKRRRRPTKPTHASRERRLEAKKHRAQAKRLRKPPSGE